MQNGKSAIIASGVLLCIASIIGAEPVRTTGRITVGTEWSTAWHAIDSGQPGPKVLIVGGVHGNEPAGAAAADQIRYWSIHRGKLVVLPRANPAGLIANTRYLPGEPEELRDLNRNFAKTDESAEPRGEVAEALWDFIKSERPDWLVDLHEGFDFTQLNGKSVGSSIIRYSSPQTEAVVPLMLDALNRQIDDPEKDFIKRGPPVNGSLARAAAERLGAQTMILETTSKQPLSLRVRQHRLLVDCLLAHLGMSQDSANVLVDRHLAKAAPLDPICVALYDAGGTGGSGCSSIESDLNMFQRTLVARVGPADIQEEVLKQFDVVVFPGGSGSAEAKAIGEKGLEAVRQFVHEGGGYVSMCAGSYLATSGYTWGLRVLDAKTVDSKHWNRGKGTVEIELSEAGRKILGDRQGRIPIHYANGPLLAPAGLNDLPDFESLALFRTEIAQNGAPKGVMLDTPAIVSGTCGKGRVLCFSPHPEATDGLEAFVERAVEWAARREADNGK